jgi:hypothetical protein
MTDNAVSSTLNFSSPFTLLTQSEAEQFMTLERARLMIISYITILDSNYFSLRLVSLSANKKWHIHYVFRDIHDTALCNETEKSKGLRYSIDAQKICTRTMLIFTQSVFALKRRIAYLKLNVTKRLLG